ncbi:TIGR04255 family protein [Lawsonibacter hominis]|uniref:TIGR04255 family protein n=1 Tax=Lawsonibacter hominis TaxID=2763053 RepID=UPI003322F493
MLFAEYDRCQYARSPLVEVICQLRFPTILNIGAKDPAEFQEAVRHDFPRYMARQEQPPPKVKPGPTPALEPQAPITNYNFVSADGKWKLNLTSSFIALSTLRYQHWEDFAARLDKPLAQFIQIYQPAFFERIGLRYVNAFSRRALGLEELLWDDLIREPYLGILGEPDVEEADVSKCAVDVESALAGGYRMKLHAGPGLLGGGKADKEVKFILDEDLSANGSLSADSVPGKLEDLHRYAVRLFRGAITPELHNALGPTPPAE